MSAVAGFLQNAQVVAFGLLGIATSIGWLRRRDRAMGFLALAIVLLSTVSLLARVPSLLHHTPPLLSQLELALFMGSGYALLRYRGSLIPLPLRWSVTAFTVMVAASGLYIAAQVLNASRDVLGVAGMELVLIWSLAVGEPIVRFWVVARRLPAVQAWRLRTLSLGFGGLVLILAFAVSVGALASQPLAQIATELVAIAIVPLLYVSFSPPGWLRREWRASEEEGLRAFMEELLLSRRHAELAGRALEWATRLVGGESAVLFDRAGKAVAAKGVDSEEVAELTDRLRVLERGVNRVRLGDGERSLLVLSVAGLVDSWTLVILAGPFTPGFGGDEVRRAQQFMSAFVTALDRARLVAELEETNARLKEASRHKSMFLANMSHELRTPLNAIIGFSELLSDAREGQFDEATRKRFLAQILNGGRHLLGLINDILDLSKVEAGQMELHLQTVPVQELVDQVVRTVEPLVSKKGIRLHADVQSAGEMQADAGKLKQMLLNLVSNAIKFTPDGGSITIRAARGPKSMEISVIDTGIGMSDADQAQIFQEFHQLDSGPARRHEGTGLGLALTKRFALLHGGDVQVRSRVNEGSVFTLTLPLEQRPAEAVKEAAGATAVTQTASGPLVLVVEDDAAAAELLTRQLGSAGYRTHVARNGREALAKAREIQPAAITLDVILPELDGWEVLAQLKSHPATSAIPVVVVSVVDNPELGIALGAIDYLVKPVDGKALIARLKRLSFIKSAGQPRVLVVDDEPANRDWLTNTLAPAGFDVLSASGGQEAISKARSQKPDLVLLDLMMPEVSGFDVVEALRSREDTRETPIMILSAANLTDDDKRRLNGRVSQVLRRGSVGASDIVSLLKRTVNGVK